jgi:hypothetical protein
VAETSISLAVQCDAYPVPNALVLQGALHCWLTSFPAHDASQPGLSGVSLGGAATQLLTAGAAEASQTCAGVNKASFSHSLLAKLQSAAYGLPVTTCTLNAVTELQVTQQDLQWLLLSQLMMYGNDKLCNGDAA